ncbi:MAG: family 43 glycosylhydrolase, partial [Bacteroidota bacterium]
MPRGKRLFYGENAELNMGQLDIRAIVFILVMLAWCRNTKTKQKPFAGYEKVSVDRLLHVDDIRIRDPFVLSDTLTGNYYMYAQMDNRLNGRGDSSKPKGVEVYRSKDLKSWTAPKTVLLLPEDFWGRNMVWAPEVHGYRGKYYLFVTITSHDELDHLKTPKGKSDWPKFYKRGTQIFVSDTPEGPFTWFDNKPHTPADWMALDGTLWEEDKVPYMVFCHEWVEIVDGTMDYVQLKKDLSKTVGAPKLMFRASEADWTGERERHVTDGCYLYRTKTGSLWMNLSSAIDASTSSTVLSTVTQRPSQTSFHMCPIQLLPTRRSPRAIRVGMPWAR